MASNNARLLADPALQPIDVSTANMRIKVHVREKTFVVSCGDGGQRISWLANVGIVRYDEKTKGMELGAPRGVRLEDGTKLNMDDVVCTQLNDGADVWVVLKDMINTEYDAQREATSVGVAGSAVRGGSPGGR